MSDLSSTPIPLGEISQGPSALEQFLDRNQKLITIAAIVAALGLGAYFVSNQIKADHAADASVALTKAQDIADLEKIVKDFDSTPSAASAMLAIAEKQWGNLQKEEAVTTLRAMIEKFPDHAARPIAQSTLGYHLIDLGKTGDAEVIFKGIIDDQNARFLAPAAMVALGDLAKQNKDLVKAKEYYDKASKEYTDSSLANMAKDRAQFLNFQAPTEIEAPPAPVTPPATLPLNGAGSLIQPDDAETTPPADGNPLLDSLKGKPDMDTPLITPPAEAPVPAPVPAEAATPEKPTESTTPPIVK